MHISLTKTKHTWFQARNKCSLIGNEHTNINISTVNSDPIWTGDSARYLPWVEYLGDYLEKPCNTYPAKCQGDKTAFCGSGNPSFISDAFSIYQKERLDNGNCLAVDRQIDSLYYVARNCSMKYFQICLNGSVHQQNNMENRIWIDSFNICFPSYMLSRYSLVYNANFTRIGTYCYLILDDGFRAHGNQPEVTIHWIGSKLVKELATEIVPILKSSLKTSIETGDVSCDWRNANVSPVSTKGERYRTIDQDL
ncbi:unnamed protein product [Mytilus coruscus]|uniref:C-type lectin domain-containing protein n=1 Tax=Mytilus coruscus TaxID=42192 RepID=A0A6J8A2D6_MYTCO|nr:unnamed protein product [Mytilus coruscus]